MVDLSKGSSDTAVPEGKGKKRWVKYVIIAAVVLGIIGSLEDGGDESGSSHQSASVRGA